MITKLKASAIFFITVAFCGCIIIPTTDDQVLSGKKIDDKQLVFIEEGVTRKQEIIELLGFPDIHLIDENIFVYNWRTRRAIMLWAVAYGYQGAFGALDIPADHMFLISFDEENIVRKWKVSDRTWYQSYGDHLIEWINEDEK